MRRYGSGIGLVLGGMLLMSPLYAAEKWPTITVRSPRRAYQNLPLTVALPPSQGKPMTLTAEEVVVLEARGSKERLVGQLTTEGGKTACTFLIPDLPQGVRRIYRLLRVKRTEAPPSPTQIRVSQTPDQVEVAFVRQGVTTPELFTRYTTRSGPNKPFFYPLLMPGERHLTRRWPMEEVAGETRDHPHHRGLWFTHGKVNGFDYWSEEKGATKTVHQQFEKVQSGPVFGGFEATTAWQDPNGKTIATDRRRVRVYLLPNQDRILDFELKIHPVGGPLIFGDTKEGMFGLRLPDALAPSRKQGGHAQNANGEQDGAVWGKKAPWVDYWGPIQGETYGVAIFASTRNIRYPETWHARDYGLFAANPFGLHDFGMGDKGAGDFTIAQNGSLTFSYRLLFHKGDTTVAAVADHYANYADPPDIQVTAQ